MNAAKDGAGANRTKSGSLEGEIERVRRLREDVLLLRFYLDRRTDIARLIDETDRLLSESALKSSLEILNSVATQQIQPAGKVAATASALMHAVGVLIHAARLVAQEDAAGEEDFPVTPQSLRASLPEDDIAAALGFEPVEDKRKTATQAADYLTKTSFKTLLIFMFTVITYILFTMKTSASALGITDEIKDILIAAFGLFWALVGSMVWVLMRFRSFGAAYAFDPAHAQVFGARVCSGAVVSAILLLFVFGGDPPKMGNWKINIPLWGFVLGYAGRLQVELLRALVSRVETAIKTVFPPTSAPPPPKNSPPGGKGARAAEKEPKPPHLPTLKEPEEEKSDPGTK